MSSHHMNVSWVKMVFMVTGTTKYSIAIGRRCFKVVLKGTKRVTRNYKTT